MKTIKILQLGRFYLPSMVCIQQVMYEMSEEMTKKVYV